MDNLDCKYLYIQKRLCSIFGNTDLTRISLKYNDEICVTDVHGMKCYQAKRFINNIINVLRITFRLVIIHGYNHGTAIKDMLADNFINTHILEQRADLHNQGITRMLIAA